MKSTVFTDKREKLFFVYIVTVANLLLMSLKWILLWNAYVNFISRLNKLLERFTEKSYAVKIDRTLASCESYVSFQTLGNVYVFMFIIYNSVFLCFVLWIWNLMACLRMNSERNLNGPWYATLAKCALASFSHL